MPKTGSGLNIERLRELARSGAAAALKELRAEIVALERTFPELALPSRRRTVRRVVKRVTRQGREMSDAARAAVSRRMKKYWA